MKNRVINFYPWHFEIKKGVLIFYGERKDKGERHELRIHFENPDFWFRYLAEDCIKYLKGRIESLNMSIRVIRNKTL